MFICFLLDTNVVVVSQAMPTQCFHSGWQTYLCEPGVHCKVRMEINLTLWINT